MILAGVPIDINRVLIDINRLPIDINTCFIAFWIGRMSISTDEIIVSDCWHLKLWMFRASVRYIFNHVNYKKSFRSNLPSENSPDSSGSPLLGVGYGDAVATADSGTGHDTRRKCRLLIEIINDESNSRI